MRPALYFSRNAQSKWRNSTLQVQKLLFFTDVQKNLTTTTHRRGHVNANGRLGFPGSSPVGDGSLLNMTKPHTYIFSSFSTYSFKKNIRRTPTPSSPSTSTAPTSTLPATTTPSINLHSDGFSLMRKEKAIYVDKTNAIADFLGNRCLSGKSFFTRPRRFGKSLTLNVIGEILGAGTLPKEVKPWPGYKPVDIEAMFGGLAVHDRFIRKDASLGELLRTPHFVIKLSLITLSGAYLHEFIIQSLAKIAGRAFSRELQTEVRECRTISAAMDALTSAVPMDIPIVILVDEYDASITRDVTAGRWEAAEQGVEALQSLMLTSKDLNLVDRIKYFIVTGISRFARASLFSGANNFTDITSAPIASRMLGFNEEEIRGNYSAELVRLGKSMQGLVGSAKSDAELQDHCMEQLKYWYNGYCFDGETTCFNPTPVLSSLLAGKLTGTELEGASSSEWLGIAPDVVLQKLVTEKETITANVKTVDIAELRDHTVNATGMLLQTGLLTQVCGDEKDSVANKTRSYPGEAAPIRLMAPNQYARNSILRMIIKTTAISEKKISAFSHELREAVISRNREKFGISLCQALAHIAPDSVKETSKSTTSNSTSKATLTNPEEKASMSMRESSFHIFSQGLFLGCMPETFCSIISEQESVGGRADLVLHLKEIKGPHPQPATVWILEFAVARKKDSSSVLAKKLQQAQKYFQPFASSTGSVASIVVDQKKQVRISWAEWDASAQESNPVPK